jgi:hypothetical protein
VSDLDTIDPGFVEVALTGRAAVQIRPITVGQLPRFLRVVKPLVGAVAGGGSPLSTSGHGPDTLEVNLLDLYVEHGERLNEAVSVATGLPQDEIDALPVDDALRLAMAVWEVNRDFFGQRVAPLLAQMMRQGIGSGPTP